MKKFLVLITVLLVGLLVMSETITFWTTQVESGRQQRIKALASIFESQTGHKIEIVPIEENEILRQIPLAQKSNTLPDVTEGGISPMLLLGSQGFMDVELNTKIIEDLGDIYSGAERLLSDGKGNHFAIPFSAWVQGIWYRKDWTEPRSLGEPTSWYNLLTAAKALNNPAEGVYGLVLPKAADAYTEQAFTEIALSNGARPIDAEGNIMFDSQKMIEAFRFYKELGKYSRPGFTSVLDALKGYLSGEAAMVFYSTYIMDDIAVEEVQRGRVDEFNPDLVKNTDFGNKMFNIRASSFGEIVAVSVLSTSDNKDVAEQWVKFLMTGDNYVYYLHMAPGGMNPTRSSIAGSEEFLDNPILSKYDREQITGIVSALDEIERFEFLDGEIIEEMSQLSSSFVISKAINYMFANDWTPQETARWAQEEAERVLDK
ncbi:MAG: ABC transporter substrate-binding protein [Thermotogota bacterium]